MKDLRHEDRRSFGKGHRRWRRCWLFPMTRKESSSFTRFQPIKTWTPITTASFFKIIFEQPSGRNAHSDSMTSSFCTTMHRLIRSFSAGTDWELRMENFVAPTVLSRSEPMWLPLVACVQETDERNSFRLPGRGDSDCRPVHQTSFCFKPYRRHSEVARALESSDRVSRGLLWRILIKSTCF